MHWNMHAPKQCKHYRKPTLSYHFDIARCSDPGNDAFEKDRYTYYILCTRIQSQMVSFIPDRPDGCYPPSTLGLCELKTYLFSGLVVH